MNRKVIFIALGIAALVLVAITVASMVLSKNRKPVDRGDITLTYWRLFEGSDRFQPFIDLYQKENPKVKIEYKKLTPTDYENQLNEALAGGRGPDLFSIHHSWLPKFTDKITPIPETDYSTNDYRQQFFPVVADENIRDNRIYGMPYSVDSLALFYNQDMFGKAEIDEPPKTWEDIVGRAPDPTRPGDTGNPGMLTKLNIRQGNAINRSAIALGNTTVARAQDIQSLLMLQQGTKMVNDDRNQAIFNLTQKQETGQEVNVGTEALKFFTSFADPRTPNYSWNSQLGNSVQAFTTGRTAMMVGYSYNIPTIERANPNLRYQIAPVPQIGGRDPVNYASYWTEVVSKTSPNQKEAWDFIKFMVDKEKLKEYNDANNSVPSRKDVSPTGKLTTFYEQSPTAQSWYKGDYAKADQIFLDMIGQVLGGEDPQRAIDNAANKLTIVLKNLKGEN